MTFPDITHDLKTAMPDLRGRLLANEPLAPLTWFRVGGVAQALFTPADADDLAYFLANLAEDIPVIVIGVGSNLIVRDGGMTGIVIRLSPRGFGSVTADGDTLTAGTAALDRRVAEAAAVASISGLEFYFGIPGSIGGALRTVEGNSNPTGSSNGIGVFELNRRNVMNADLKGFLDFTRDGA